MHSSKLRKVQVNGATNGTTNGDAVNRNGSQKHHANGVRQNGHQAESKERRELSFLEDFLQIMVQDGIVKANSYDGKVLDFHHPHELKKKFDLAIKDSGEDDEVILSLCEQTIKYSVKTGHPYYFNQLFQGYDVYGMAGALLTEVLNTSQYTYEVAPLFTLIEQETIRRMLEIVGFQDGDGIFCPGGSISNFYGINTARFNKFPEVKTKGMQAIPKLCLFTSDQSHYSISKGAAFCGIGLDNIVKVKCDSRGKMIPSELEKEVLKKKSEGFVPLMVNATAGTTVSGAYDPINDIADVCQKYDIWLHVDAAWGGGCFMTSKYKHLVDGIERVNSITWDPHKMAGAPLQCVVFLVQNKDILKRCHSANATYLFQQDKFYDVSYDTGDKSIQCGRKVDAFKLWLMWKAKGNKGFEAEMNNVFEQAEYLADQCRTREGFQLVIEKPECTNVCFWYMPPSMRGQERTPDWWLRLSKVAPKIKELMMVQGTLLVGYQPLGEHVNFFRMVVSNTKAKKEDMDFILDEIHRLGHDL